MAAADQLRRDLARRQDTDYQIDFALNLLLTIVTCLLWGFVSWYRILHRRDLHFARSADFADDSIRALRERAEALGRQDRIAPHLGTLEVIARDLRMQARERNAILWVILGIFTLKVVFLVMFYFLEEDYRRHELMEVEFARHLDEAMQALGVPCTRSSFVPVTKERSYPLYLVVTLLTCGLFGFYWFYRMNEDQNRHMDAHAAWEPEVLGCLAGPMPAGAPAPPPTPGPAGA
jgi:hypothetical protein